MALLHHTWVLGLSWGEGAEPEADLAGESVGPRRARQKAVGKRREPGMTRGPTLAPAAARLAAWACSLRCALPACL